MPELNMPELNVASGGGQDAAEDGHAERGVGLLDHVVERGADTGVLGRYGTHQRGDPRGWEPRVGAQLTG
jgi:hypothetical protein